MMMIRDEIVQSLTSNEEIITLGLLKSRRPKMFSTRLIGNDIS